MIRWLPVAALLRPMRYLLGWLCCQCKSPTDCNFTVHLLCSLIFLALGFSTEAWHNCMLGTYSAIRRILSPVLRCLPSRSSLACFLGSRKSRSLVSFNCLKEESAVGGSAVSHLISPTPKGSRWFGGTEGHANHEQNPFAHQAEGIQGAD